ncbi:MAG: hypothetical protein WB630_16310 [Candidatus Acidiferrales bacterium]
MKSDKKSKLRLALCIAAIATVVALEVTFAAPVAVANAIFAGAGGVLLAGLGYDFQKMLYQHKKLKTHTP